VADPGSHKVKFTRDLQKQVLSGSTTGDTQISRWEEGVSMLSYTKVGCGLSQKLVAHQTSV
jgi:hypothetical protein